jgi:hypothetical protein
MSLSLLHGSRAAQCQVFNPNPALRGELTNEPGTATKVSDSFVQSSVL